MKVRISIKSADRTDDIPRAYPARLLPEAWRPVMYLDVDDTLLRYPSGREGDPVVADGAREFFAWARDVYEVRWLTKWCRAGAMGDDLVDDFCRMLDVDVSVVHSIRGLDWSFSDTKLNAIAWLEHLVLERPFVWVEDDYGVGTLERRFLAEQGLEGCWRRCNVTERPDALMNLHRTLLSELARPCVPAAAEHGVGIQGRSASGG